MYFTKILAPFAVTLALTLSATSAQAVPIFNFNFSCLSCEVTGISFSLPESPAVSSRDDFSFTINGVANSTGTAKDLSFFTGDSGGGFGDFGLLDVTSQQLFTGTTFNPVFILGTFPTASGTSTGTLVISRANSVPEPATLGLFGMALLGFAATRRKPTST